MNNILELRSDSFRTLMAYFRCAIMEIETKNFHFSTTEIPSQTLKADSNLLKALKKS